MEVFILLNFANIDGNQIEFENDNSYGMIYVTVIVKEAEDIAMPIASLLSGVYQETQSVKLLLNRDSAKIYYTTDGSEPDEKSTPYDSPIEVEKDTIIKAVAVK